jgi:hypothetical protein
METNHEVIELLKQIAHNTAQTELRLLSVENTINEIHQSLNSRIELIDSRIELTNAELQGMSTILSSMDISEGYNLKDLWEELSDIKYKTTDNGAYNIKDIIDGLHELELTIINNS